MHAKQITANPHFIGRTQELIQLAEIGASDKARILILYGRRRMKWL